MISITLAVLLLLALWLALAARRRACAGVLVAALALWLAAGCGPLASWLLEGLQSGYAGAVQGTWAERNAIVLLGAGTVRTPSGPEPELFAYGRIARAAALYHDCKAAGRDCKLLASGGDAQHHGIAEAVSYAALLRRLGVPDADLLLETRSNSTWQNAQFSRPLLLAYAPRRVLLVTSGIHLRRSLLYFAHFALRPEPVRGDYVRAVPSWLPLAWNVALCDAALHEYVGIARYYVYNAMGWNVPPVAGPGLPAEAR
jgi:uncharacterized SAM-binding protein YcdF (DUF218 family)